MTAAPKPDNSSNFLAELRAGETPGEAPIMSSAAPKRRVNVQTLVVVGVVVASAGLLYAMRLHGMGAGMKFDTVEINYDWSKAGQDNRAHHSRVLADLARSGEPIKPPVDHLPQNPFALDLDAPVTETPVVTHSDPNAEARRQELARQVREKEIISALANLQLHSVMEGRIPLARIGSKLYRLGDKVGEHFTIAGVHGRTVDLEADGRTYSLSIEEPVTPDEEP